MYQEEEDEFMVNYFNVTRMTLGNTNFVPKDNHDDISNTRISSTSKTLHEETFVTVKSDMFLNNL